MGIGKIIGEKLKECGKSAAWLSRQTGIPASTLRSMISRDSDRTDIDTIRKIAAALNTNAFVLLGEEQSKQLDTDTIIKIADDERKRRESHADDYEYLYRLSVPAFKLNEKGRELLYNDAVKYTGIEELTNGKKD